MLVLGYDVEYVTIVPTADSWGRTKPMTDSSELYDRLLCVRAGEAAEARYTKNALETRIRTVSVDGDQQIAEGLLDLHEAGGTPISRVEVDANATRKAHQLVNEYAPALIDAIADALLQAETLDNARIRQIFSSFKESEDGLRLVRI